ncbi:MAG: tetratricopeptide repeat protein [Bacillota bacterium]|nr:tetratricopeptide repeat protein [Bacillota bacterium]
MKKRGPVKHKENVIYFPGLEKRLTEKGLESLHKKKYKEAIDFLEDARDHDPENEDVLIGLVLAYFEASSLKKAKDLANEMLLKGIGEYLQMVDLYLTILIQLHEYSEIVSTIEALLEEREIPPEKQEHFVTILQFSRRMAESNPSIKNDDSEKEEVQQAFDLISIQDLKEQMLYISSLSEKNIRPYLNEIQEYLKGKSGHPFIKTMLLNVLMEQEYDQKLMVEKFNRQIEVTPTELEEIKSQEKMMEIEEILKERVESHNPILFENIKSLMERYFFMYYPFSLEPAEPAIWASAFHFVVLEYYGEEPRVEEFTSEYGIENESLSIALMKIREIEEISYPII